MQSPFPGMNPYLEQAAVWRDFHTTYLVELRRALAPLVEPNYFIGLEESLYIDRASAGELFAVADLGFARNRPTTRSVPAATVLDAPMTATLPPRTFVVRRSRRWLTIRDQDRRKIVTVIELLSPSNKTPGDDRVRYLSKRERILDSTAHFIEIDLLRGGQRSPRARNPVCDYCISISRRRERPRVGVRPIALRDSLPTIPIPLRTGEPEPLLALKPPLDAAYDVAGYRRRIYQGTPNPPLSRAEAAWARAIVRRAGATP